MYLSVYTSVLQAKLLNVAKPFVGSGIVFGYAFVQTEISEKASLTPTLPLPLYARSYGETRGAEGSYYYVDSIYIYARC